MLNKDYLKPRNPDAVGVESFGSDEARRIHSARMDHLAGLGLPLDGKRVLEVGCGIGHLTGFFLERSCRVVCLDGRESNLALLRERHPGVEAHRVDIDNEPLKPLGTFDVVFCYGLLYHLENPVIALRRMAEVCDGMLLLETMITDHELPLTRLADESPSANQSLGGIGQRPTPSYLAFVLDRAGFPFLYAPKRPPKHPDFEFKWRNDLNHTRDGRNLRCVFIASKHELKNPNLTCLYPA